MSESLYEDIKKDLNVRINKIIGQTNGLKRMIENERSCREVLDQIYAIRTAIDSVSNLILEHYITTRIGSFADLPKNDELFKILKIVNRGK